MKIGINRPAVLGLSIVLGMMTMLPGTSFAATQCKGMEKRACENKTDCSWVDGYKRKDGKTVSSYCRSTAKKSTSTSSSKKKDTKKSDAKKKDDKK